MRSAAATAGALALVAGFVLAACSSPGGTAPVAPSALPSASQEPGSRDPAAAEEGAPDALEAVRPGDRLPRRGDEILVCGQLFHTGTPVVLWTDPHGYDAYRVEPRFGTEPARADAPEGARYGTLRKHLDDEQRDRVLERGWRLEELQEEVQQFVLHYDVCGTSRQCFRVLHDLRGLSVHFLLDLDGTIYQTLDLKERAWHAGTANDRSIGIEIAHIGAYPQPDAPPLREFYAVDAEGVRLSVPERLARGAPDAALVLRPARPELVRGAIHGRTLYQYDFTPQQYEALSHLVATLHRALPRIALDAPRDGAGRVRTDVLSDAERTSFEGVIGHWHVTTGKIDPGPAMDWDRFLGRAAELLEGSDLDG